MFPADPPSQMTCRQRREMQLTDASEPPSERGPEALRILTVCTGNICRSALAEVLLRTELEPSGVVVHSAGTHALVGSGMPPEQQRIALGRGAAAEMVDAHRAQQLVEPLVADADLVIAMTKAHRRYAMRLVPAQLRRIFTAVEFAQLSAQLTDEQLAAIASSGGASQRERFDALVFALDARRSAGTDDEDIVDPYRRSAGMYEQSAQQLAPVLREVTRVVRRAVGA